MWDKVRAALPLVGVLVFFLFFGYVVAQAFPVSVYLFHR